MNLELLQNPLWHRLGWTLLHFLWQGAAIAALLFLALQGLRRQAANVRYSMACVALTSMVAVPVWTFCTLEEDPIQPSAASISGTVPKETQGTAEAAPLSVNPTESHGRQQATWYTWFRGMEHQVQSVLPGIVFLWLTGVIIFSCRMGAGWIVLRSLRAHASPLPDWDRRLEALQEKLGIRRKVRIARSDRVDSPSIFGWSRPFILFPAGALTGLNPAQLEAILLHELAHVRRHDYLVNLAQNLIEMLFYYHPAVWWVSRQIREEREKCCDDLVLQNGGQALNYAQALTGLEEMRAASPLRIAAQGGSLTHRIRRLMGLPSESASSTGWLAAALTLIAIAAGVSVAQVTAQETGDNTGATDHKWEGAIAVQVRIAEISAKLAEDLGLAVPSSASQPEGTAPSKTTDLGIAPSSITAILTPEQHQSLISTLEESGGVDLLAAPRITTVSGRKAEVSIAHGQDIVSGSKDPANPTNLETNKVQVGPSVEVTPRILDPGHSLHLSVSSEIREFVGYEVVRVYGPANRSNIESVPPAPKVRIRTLTANGVVHDSQTLASVGSLSYETIKFKDKVPVLGDIPLLGRLFRNEATFKRRNYLLILVRPTRVDSSGKPLYPPDTTLFDRNILPAQYEMKDHVN